MSYTNDDMIANSDRGYEMDLDCRINELFKKHEAKNQFTEEDIQKMLEDEYEDLLDDAIGFGL